MQANSKLSEMHVEMVKESASDSQLSDKMNEGDIGLHIFYNIKPF